MPFKGLQADRLQQGTSPMLDWLNWHPSDASRKTNLILDAG
jgi:hypothetical protein